MRLTYTTNLLTDSLNHQILEQINKSTHLTAENTTLGDYDVVTISVAIIALIISVVALVYTIITFISQKKTEKNTSRLSLDSQKNLLIGMIRHMYRNMVCTCAMQHKMEARQYKAYPSEEHLLKLKIPLEYLHLDIFYGNDEKYQKMTELMLLLRNYNEEISIALSHFKDKNIERDFATLKLKPGLLSKKILDAIELVWENSEDTQNKLLNDIAGIIKESNKKRSGSNFTDPYTNPNDWFILSLFNNSKVNYNAADFFMWLNEDIEIECGNNEQDSPKIHLIELQ